jgi:transcription initiation factor TFIIB
MHYKRVRDVRASEDKSRDAVLAVCIFIACRDCNTPCTFSEICAFTDVPKEEANVAYNPIEGFLASAHDETVQHFRLSREAKVFIEGRIGWLGRE